MDNEVVVIDGTPVTGRNISQDAKTFRCKSVLLFLDGPVYDFKHTKIEVNNPVKVYNSEHEPLGYANVNAVNDKLIADISINYSCEERLLTETKQERFYSVGVGAVRLNTQTTLNFDSKERVQVSFFVIDSIILTRNCPKDKRIPVFGEIVL